ncbi:MAG: mannitol dehydrogenase family protein [Streptosporangiaceae bacterium]
MNGIRLARDTAPGRAAAPVRLIHLGLGNFFRAHQCWYTDHASDGEDWGIAAFTGTASRPVVGQLNAQEGLFTLVTRADGGDKFEVLSSLSRAHAAAEHDAWLRYFESPQLSVVTVTVTEAGYLRGPHGGIDLRRPEVQADLAVLRRDPAGLVTTAPARLLAGFAARCRGGNGPVALVPCDNTPHNGQLAELVVRELAELVSAGLARWLAESLAVVTTMADRITPGTSPADVGAVRDSTGFDDRCPVVCEPFREWVLSGTFPAGRPAWETAGAAFVTDVTPYEQRKLWLLNGAHSLLAYAGSIVGHRTVAAATADQACRGWLEEWWRAAELHLPQPAAEVAAYRRAVLQRLSNTRMQDRLDRIAADGSQKLPIRILPVLRAERAVGRVPAGATRVLAAWVCHLRGLGAPVSDARAGEVVPLAAGPLRAAIPRVLGWLDPALGNDADVLAAVADQAGQFERGQAAS